MNRLIQLLLRLGIFISVVISVSCAEPTVVSAAKAQPSSDASANAPISPSSNPFANASAQAPSHKLQQGPWYPTPWNYEEPYINIVHASDVRWRAGERSTQDLLDQGYIDPKSGLPIKLPSVVDMQSGFYFQGDEQFVYDGTWVLEWEGDASLELQPFPPHRQKKISSNRIEFTRDSSKGTTYPMAVKITRLDEPLRALRIYRKENEPHLRAGQIYNPKFAEQLRRGHVVRMMDLQNANLSVITRMDELASDAAQFWGNRLFYHKSNTTISPFRSMPLRAVVRAGIEADVEVWHHAPMTLGAPQRWAGDRKSFVAQVSAHSDAILDSPEWDRYADALVAALIAENYPPERVFYTTLDNEVWNFGLQYLVSTQYANAFGQTISDRKWAFRQGYGLLMARWALAFDAALERAGREQRVVYVIEGHKSNAESLSAAFGAAKAEIERRGKNWSSFAPKFGGSVSSYWGNGCWATLFPDKDSRASALADAVRVAPAKLIGRIEDCVLRNKSAKGSLPTLLRRWAGHKAKVESFGAKFIGAYEGGSHFSKKKFETKDVSAFRQSFLRSARAAAINTKVNAALITQFPDAVLANYVIGAPAGKAPWNDGLIGENTYMQQSWRQFER